MKNPFEIKTPEQNTAEEIVKLFVDVFSDFHQVPELGHTFLNGPRGSGKSMMFRYLLPDCQKIVTGKNFNELDFFSIYIPIKLTNINISELERFENHASSFINEHLLVTYVLSKTFKFIYETYSEELNKYTDEILYFFKNDFLWNIELLGIETLVSENKNGFCIMKDIAVFMDKLNRECTQYCKKVGLSGELLPYSGPLMDFIDFFCPVISALKKIPCFPQGKPFFFLIDDAGYLNESQTKVLNTWVSYRSTKDICIKISTQLDYKNYLTTTGKRIDSPHDYSEVNIATIYTSSNRDYYKRVKAIVERRINVYLNKETSAEDFFPNDKIQEEKIKALYDEILEKNFDDEKEYAGGDAARRYSRPEYIKRLQETKSGSTYSYAGFNQLVAISSGIIRNFLAPAQDMYAESLSRNNSIFEGFISDSIQNEIIKKYSTSFLEDEFSKIFKDCLEDEKKLKKADKLYNLITSLGELFHRILVSNCSERRVFSVALTTRPDYELKEILDMGIQLGYLHESTIGNKLGGGRNKLYVLSRLLAPHFKLDPTSFAGYQFMSSDDLKVALYSTKKFLNIFSKKLIDGEKVIQKELDFEIDE